MLCARDTEIGAKDIIVQNALVIAKIQVAELWVPYFMFAGIEIGYRTRARFLRPESGGILAQEMIVI